MLAGIYSFAADLRSMNFVPGNHLTVKVTVNGTTKTYKVITAE